MKPAGATAPNLEVTLTSRAEWLKISAATQPKRSGLGTGHRKQRQHNQRSSTLSETCPHYLWRSSVHRARLLSWSPIPSGRSHESYLSDSREDQA